MANVHLKLIFRRTSVLLLEVSPSFLLSADHGHLLNKLSRSSQGTVKQAYTGAPVVDNELLRLSLRLFKRRSACRTPGPDKAEDGKLAPPGEQELCVS